MSKLHRGGLLETNNVWPQELNLVNFKSAKASDKAYARQVLANLYNDGRIEGIVTSSTSIKGAIDKFIFAHYVFAQQLFNLQTYAYGAGEVLLYYIFDDVALGGTEKTGDLHTPHGVIEIKSVRTVGGTHAVNFRLAKKGDKATQDAISSMKKFNDKYKTITGDDLPGIQNGSFSEVSKKKFEKLLNIDLDGNKFQDIVDTWVEDVIKEFENTPILFLVKNSRCGSLKEVVGPITLSKDNLRIELITQNLCKPIVKIKR